MNTKPERTSYRTEAGGPLRHSRSPSKTSYQPNDRDRPGRGHRTRPRRIVSRSWWSSRRRAARMAARAIAIADAMALP